MNHNHIILILAFLVIPYVPKAQVLVNKYLTEAQDSANSNPNHSYLVLRDILKETYLSDSNRIKTYILLGNYFNKTGHTDSAIFYAKKVLSENLPIEKERALYATMGNAYCNRGVYNEAKKWFFKGLESCAKIDCGELFYSLKSGLATVYAREGELEKSLPLFEECLNFKGRLDFYYGSLINVGNVHLMLKNYTKAEKYYLKGLSIAKQSNSKESQAIASLNIGDVKFFHNEDFEGAFKYYSESAALALENNIKKTYIRATIGKGRTFSKGKKNYLKAETIFKTALDEAKQAGDLGAKKEIYEELENIYLIDNNYTNAYNTSVLLRDLKDSIQNISKQKIVKEMEVKYETIQKEREIDSLKFKQEQDKMEARKKEIILFFLVVGFILIVVFLLVVLFVYFGKLKTERKLKALEIMQATRDEKERIASQLHDNICGNLSAVALRLETTDANAQKAVIPLIKKTLELTRGLSHDLFDNDLPTERINSLIKQYKDFSSLSISCNISQENQFNQLPEDLVFLVLNITQEIITNCIKHALATELIIDLNIDKKTLYILYEDNGVGFDSNETTSGIGIKNIQRRIKTLMGKFQLDTSPGNGVVYTVEIPFEVSGSKIAMSKNIKA